MIPFGPKPVPENRWFESKPLWARIFIMIAGVVMNTLLAVVVATVLVMQQGQRIIPSTVVGKVYDLASAPQLSQLHIGDTIRRGEWPCGRDLERRPRADSRASSVSAQITTQRGESSCRSAARSDDG